MSQITTRARAKAVTGGPERREDGQTSSRLANMRTTSDRAKEAREKAQQIFLSLIESSVKPKVFTEKLRWINPEIYEDVTKDRAAADLCGYPLCINPCNDTFGSRTYIIRSNKVYDITERRNFCSNVCYEASELVQARISNSPLYLRLGEDATEVLPNISLPRLKSLKGRYGKFVDITGGLLDIEDDVPTQEARFKPLDEIAQESLINWSEIEAEKKSEEQTHRGTKRPTENEHMEVISENEPLDSESNEASDAEKDGNTILQGSSSEMETEDELLIKKDTNVHRLKSVDEIEKIEEEIHVKTMNDGCIVKDLEKMDIEAKGSNVKSKAGKQCFKEISTEREKDATHEEPDPLVAVFEVERSMREWMSFESLVCVLGERYVRGMLEHIGATWKDYDTTAGMKLGMEARGRYIALCRKLDHQEKLEDKEMKEAEAGEAGGGEGDGGGVSLTKQPLPDYQKLKNDAKKQELKVVSFFGGQDQYEEVCSEQEKMEESAQLAPIPEEGTSKPSTCTATARQSKVKKMNPRTKKVKGGGKEEVDSDKVCTLPFVDGYCQIAWRQHIVIEKLDAYIGKVVCVCELDSNEVRRLVQRLVTTFDLSPNNITFTSRQWRLVAFIVLHLLSVRYPVIAKALKQDEVKLLQGSLLIILGLDANYWARAVSFLTEIKFIINKNFAKDTEMPPPQMETKEMPPTQMETKEMPPQMETKEMPPLMQKKEMPPPQMETKEMPSPQMETKEMPPQMETKDVPPRQMQTTEMPPQMQTKEMPPQMEMKEA